MPLLRELQRAFCAAALFGNRAALESLGLAAGRLDPGERLDVYRNNILGNYRKALAATYPVVRRLVGAPFFAAAVDRFVLRHPSTRGDINRYGGELADFLVSYPPARDLIYLADVARLEWAIDQAAIAADAPPLDLEALAAVPAAGQDALRFALHPSAKLIASPYPILRIWQVNQPNHQGDDRVDLGEGADTLLVLRSPNGISVEPIGLGEHALLSALAADATLADAATRAAEIEPGFDLADALRRRVVDRVIVAFRAPFTFADRTLQ